MSATKAGWIHEVRRYHHGGITVMRSDDRYSPFHEVELNDLQRTDIRRSCAHLGLSGAAERKNAEMVDDIRRSADWAWDLHGTIGAGYVVVERIHASQAMEHKRTGMATATAVVTGPAPVASPASPAVQAPTPTVSSGSLDQVIASVARSAASEVVAEALASFDPISVDKVQDMVTTMVNDLVSRPVVTNVTVNGGPTVTHTSRVHKQYGDVLKHIIAGDELYLWGGAGAGKTTTIRQIADDLGRMFELVTFSAQTTEAKLVGFRDVSGEVRETPLVTALRNGAVVLFDEFDACPPGIAVAINTMSANRVVSTPAGTFDLHEDTVLVFSGNTSLDGATSAYNGRSASDFSTKDRMSVVEFLYDEDLEYDLTSSALGGDHRMASQWLEIVRACRRNVQAMGGATAARIAVTPRAAISGAKLLKAGFSFQYVAEARIRKGMDSKTWDQVRNNIPALAGTV